jgi:hypothetical protein
MGLGGASEKSLEQAREKAKAARTESAREGLYFQVLSGQSQVYHRNGQMCLSPCDSADLQAVPFGHRFWRTLSLRNDCWRFAEVGSHRYA